MWRHVAGVRVLTYVNSFLTRNASLHGARYPQALAADALMRGHDGRPVTVTSGPGMMAGLLDLTVPRGVAFTTAMIAGQGAIGSSGWMADFGEYAPLHQLLSAPRLQAW